MITILAFDLACSICFLLCGGLVLVRGHRCCALWRASNLHPNSSRPHWRRAGRFCGRSNRCVVDLVLPDIPLVGESVGSKGVSKRNSLFCAYWYLRRRRNNCVLPAVSKRRSPVFGSCHSGGWRRDHGSRWHLVFPRTAIVAANRRHCFRSDWFVFPAQIESSLII
jgi:hypothetical protein